MESQSQSLRIAVMGMPGQGKSTLLNGFVMNSTFAKQYKGKNRVFEIAGSLASCTKIPKRFPDKNSPPLQVLTVGGQVPVELWDTMGWPDTDKSQATRMYDQVVTDVINNPQGLNALIWIVMQSRKNVDIWNTYKAFLTELSQAKCPIIMLMNGMAEHNGLDEEDADPSDVKAAHAALKSDAESMIREIGVQIYPTILTSVQKKDLMNISPLHIIDLLQRTRMPCRVSKLLTYTGMKEAFATSETALKKHTEDARAKIKDAQQALESQEYWQSTKVVGGAVGAGATTAGLLTYGILCVVTGPIGAAVGAVVAGSSALGALVGAGNGLEYLTNEQIKKLRSDLMAMEAALETEKGKMQAEADKKKADVDRLKAYLER